jgi:hypothetical protein
MTIAGGIIDARSRIDSVKGRWPDWPVSSLRPGSGAIIEPDKKQKIDPSSVARHG